MSAADTTFDELWSRAAEITAAVAVTSLDAKRSRSQPAQNNVGVALLVVVIALVLAAAALIGSPALGKMHHGCEAASSQVSGTNCGG